jgi:hypothetical protein
VLRFSTPQASWKVVNPKKRTTKAKLRISTVEAFALHDRIDIEAKEGNMLSVMMPNGKPLRDCTRKDLIEIAQAIEDAGSELDRLKAFFSAQRPS